MERIIFGKFAGEELICECQLGGCAFCREAICKALTAVWAVPFGNSDEVGLRGGAQQLVEAPKADAQGFCCHALRRLRRGVKLTQQAKQQVAIKHGHIFRLFGHCGTQVCSRVNVLHKQTSKVRKKSDFNVGKIRMTEYGPRLLSRPRV